LSIGTFRRAAALAARGDRAIRQGAFCDDRRHDKSSTIENPIFLRDMTSLSLAEKASRQAKRRLRFKTPTAIRHE
jgi:hypothetical protein